MQLHPNNTSIVELELAEVTELAEGIELTLSAVEPYE